MIKVGKHVSWVKVKGKPGASMQEKTGFGTLAFLENGLRMIIVGDYGVSTSPVKDFSFNDNELTVVTLNSTYIVKELSSN